MELYAIDTSNDTIIAGWMSKIKPEWWSAEDALAQLRGSVGWYIGNCHDEPQGWVLCKPFPVYRTAEIECLGCEVQGRFAIDASLQPLIEKAEDWARACGFVHMRFIMGSRGLSCHGRDLGALWEELRDVRALDREEYLWFFSMGYVPSGILPHLYGDGNHGVLLLKMLQTQGSAK